MKVEVHVDCSDGLTFKRPSLVKVQFADECDLSKIVKRFIRTGELPDLAVKKPLNVDATQVPDDYQDMQQWRVELSNLFELEPQAVKDFCQYDLERYAEFKALSNEEREKFFKSNPSPTVSSPTDSSPTVSSPTDSSPTDSSPTVSSPTVSSPTDS